MQELHPENIKDQARILCSIVYRMQSQDLRTLADLSDKASQAGMNGGTGAQLNAQQNIELMCNAAILRINRRDRATMINLIESIFTGEKA